jgi:hypothetical protein
MRSLFALLLIVVTVGPAWAHRSPGRVFFVHGLEVEVSLHGPDGARVKGIRHHGSLAPLVPAEHNAPLRRALETQIMRENGAYPVRY